SGFLILNLNPYLLDFFSLARGYGLASAFTLGSIVFYVKWLKSYRYGRLVVSLVFASTAVLCNFSLVNLFLALVALVILEVVVSDASSFKKTPIIFLVGIVTGLTILLVVRPIAELLNNQELFFGGSSGVWSDTITSLILRSTGSNLDKLNSLVFAGFALTSLIVLIGAVAKIRNPKNRFKGVTATLLVLLLILLSLQLQNWFFGTKFLFQRTALFLIPIYLVGLVLALQEIGKRFKRLGNVAAMSVALMFIVNACMVMNLNRTSDWGHERNTKTLMLDLANQETAYESYFAVKWPYSVTARFYSHYLEYNWLRIIELNGFENPSLMRRDFDLEWINADSQPTKAGPHETRMVNNESKLIIYPKRKLESSVVSSLWSESRYSGSDSFIQLREQNSSSLVKDSVLNISVQLKVKSEISLKPSLLHLVLANENGAVQDVKCSKKASDGWYSMSLTYRDKWNPDDRANIYVWNVKQLQIELKDCVIHQYLYK
ncbi:MAG: hypothetical protein ACPG5W_00740, partial [Flavobacteriales bacterium]